MGTDIAAHLAASTTGAPRSLLGPLGLDGSFHARLGVPKATGRSGR